MTLDKAHLLIKNRFKLQSHVSVWNVSNGKKKISGHFCFFSSVLQKTP